MKAFQLELWSIWLSGFILIGLSLYATQMLPSLKDQSTTPNINPNDVSDSKNLNITIFTAPKPFTGTTGTRQTLAVRSWLALSPHVTVILYSQDPSVASFSTAFGSRVLVNNDIDFTFLGTPFLHSMIAKSRSFTSDIYAIVDPETIIVSGFISTLNHAFQLDHDWLLVASSRNASYFPFHLGNSGKHWQTDNGKRVQIQQLQEILQKDWHWNHCDMKMLIAWNNGDMPLHSGVLPPFLFGKSVHNSWIIHEALSSEFRLVIDASLTITCLHLNGQDDFHCPTVTDSAAFDIASRKWEYMGNSHIGSHYGSFSCNEANYSSLLKLFRCGDQYFIMDRQKNSVYLIGHGGAMRLWKGNIFHSWLKKSTVTCIADQRSLTGMLEYSFRDKMLLSAPLELPFSLESLLSVTLHCKFYSLCS